ncbi:MAG: LuxR C-terminal-related transcriptional regulator [Chloroflexota bacterium]|nr:LuxR C-terminal-related transcriptional regulator [Chloroflexota bacterium]
MPETNLLSEREIEILQLVATGLTNREIAQSLTISPNTVKVHLRNIFDKIDVSSRTEATMYGIEHGIVDVPGSEGNLTQPGSLNMVQRSPWALMGIVLALVLFVAVGGNLLFPTAPPTPNALPAVPDRWQELALTWVGSAASTVVNCSMASS